MTGKVVVVTGAARGQGRSHAARLAEEGADVIALDVCADIESAGYPMATMDDLAETERLVRNAGRNAVTAQVDVRDRAALAAAIADAVTELGGLHAVVANAGILPMGAHRPMTAFADTVDINLGGVFNTVHAALPHLGDGASVVVVGSGAGLMPRTPEDSGAGPGFVAYKFAKRALVDYVSTLAVELASRGMRINAVHPTNVATDMLLNDSMFGAFRPDLETPTADDIVPVLTGMHAQPVAWVSPEDVSHAVLFLAGDESRHVTGMQLRVDAGMAVKAGGWIPPRKPHSG
ncbi:mycofactocin-coupled SDR family oxidoreductase [Amycolatopsis sp. WAC 01375]|uniref:mycofactocin-coupled SDR family oxidoreductase n=1 Tax=Amycolatopsis sp. WAC 01375 TaxID=2203194 RepID=UPI001F244EC4|nr:mycofactocin-coupled SDR family oxidoreductase [Amycolatopsis sp. WAC 01375]